MKKYEYAELENRIADGNWQWFIGGEKCGQTRINEELQYLTRLEALNVVGQDGWQVIEQKYNNYSSTTTFLLMREVVE